MTAIDAHVLSGEAGVCPTVALVAIAYMMVRGCGPWYGWSEETTSAAEYVARLWYTIPDPTPTARYAFSQEDLRRVAVRRIIATRKLVRVIHCAGGLSLWFYN